MYESVFWHPNENGTANPTQKLLASVITEATTAAAKLAT
jgi:hypothetical protein